MKKSIVFLGLTLFLLGNIFAQGGISFQEPNWEKVLLQAKNEDKLIFMDAYTTWCGPCKMMSRDVFPDAGVGAFYNENFISVKIDMEKGEGIDLARKYEVRAYPTLLFIDGDGNLVHRGVGYQDADRFIELGQTAMSPDNFSNLNRRYEAGERSSEFLQTYAMACMQAMQEEKAKMIAQEFLAQSDDWDNDGAREFIFYFADGGDEKQMDYFLENRVAFERQFGSEYVADRMQEMILQTAFAEGNDEETALAKMEKLYRQAYPEVADQLLGEFRMNYARYKGDIQAFAKAAVDYYNTYEATDAMELNNVAWTFFEEIEDQAMLESAVGWAEQSVEMSEEYYNLDTLAWLYFKTGNKKKAEKAAKRAIEVAKVNDEDYTATQELLEKL